MAPARAGAGSSTPRSAGCSTPFGSPGVSRGVSPWGRCDHSGRSGTEADWSWLGGGMGQGRLLMLLDDTGMAAGHNTASAGAAARGQVEPGDQPRRWIALGNTGHQEASSMSQRGKPRRHFDVRIGWDSRGGDGADLPGTIDEGRGLCRGPGGEGAVHGPPGPARNWSHRRGTGRPPAGRPPLE